MRQSLPVGYRPIRDAAIAAFPERHGRNGEDSFAERLKKSTGELGGVEYEFAGERFFRPNSVRGLLELVAQFPEGRLVAGATELGLDITRRFARFPTLISVEALPELRAILRAEAEWRIGAAAPLTQIEEQMAAEFPALADMLRIFGSRQVRNRATMGGNLVTASPIGDSAPVLLALGAKVALVAQKDGNGGTDGTDDGLAVRTLPIDEFFVAYRKTALRPGEILKTILVPRFASRRGVTRECAWYKVSKRREMDTSTVAACITVELDADRVVRHARLAYGGVAAMPVRARKTEQALIGQPWCERTVKEVMPVLLGEFTPISDVRGSAEYRRGLITGLFEKFYFSEGHGTPEHGSLPVAGRAVPCAPSSSQACSAHMRGARGIARLSTDPPPHESAHKHVTGEAVYTDDQAAGALEVWPVCSPHPHARILSRDVTAARAMPGIYAVLLAEVVRERNLYHGTGQTNTTPYGLEIGDHQVQTIWHQLKHSSDFARRREAVGQWNAAHPNRKRGLAMTPVKFGISFTVTHLNQAGALVLLYQDGTAQVNHAGTEMGQGLHTNITAIAAWELGIRLEHVRVMPTSTDKVPNTSATAASCGTDLNGAAVKNACEIIRARLAPVAARLLKEKNGRAAAVSKLVFADGLVCDSRQPRSGVSFADVVRKAYIERISLSATGFYATPGIYWDRVAGRGNPFHYFACGAAVSEVEVDGFTGMTRVLRTDILHDVGDSINEAVNRGQVEGGFVLGMGWLTTEKLKWDERGRLLTHSPDTYKIPAVGDMPKVFNVTLLKNAAQKGVVYGSKAAGEPPFMLAISVREAIRDAVAAFGSAGVEVPLALPATCEAIFMVIQRQLKCHKALAERSEFTVAAG
jgi:xanthine dehydrogenase iron-sulfur cluster and FAD-binding subunit A